MLLKLPSELLLCLHILEVAKSKSWVFTSDLASWGYDNVWKSNLVILSDGLYLQMGRNEVCYLVPSGFNFTLFLTPCAPLLSMISYQLAKLTSQNSWSGLWGGTSVPPLQFPPLAFPYHPPLAKHRCIYSGRPQISL